MSDPDPTYVAALRILKYRFNSELELRRKLQGKRFEKGAIDAAIERLREEKWLDDDRFASAFVRTRANKSVGRMRIRRELQSAGVSEESAKLAIAENVDPERELEALHALCARRARVLVRRHGAEYLGTEEAHAKLTSYLVGQGYDFALVREVVAELTRSRSD